MRRLVSLILISLAVAACKRVYSDHPGDALLSPRAAAPRLARIEPDLDGALEAAAADGDRLIALVEARRAAGRWLWYDPATLAALRSDTLAVKRARADLDGTPRGRSPIAWRAALDTLNGWQDTYLIAAAPIEEIRQREEGKVRAEIETLRQNAAALRAYEPFVGTEMAAELRAVEAEIDRNGSDIAERLPTLAHLRSGEWIDAREDLADLVDEARQAYWHSLARLSRGERA